MKIAFVSNYLNHHQFPFSQAMCNITGTDFTFVVTKAIPRERQLLGYQDMNHSCDFCLCAYDSEEKKRQAETICKDCDIMVIGSAPSSYAKERNNSEKITFYYSERLFKDKRTGYKTIGRYIKYTLKRKQFKGCYLLCASAYTAADYAGTGNFRGRAYKWGYFPETKRYDLNRLLGNKKAGTILWAGRFIDWKHPEYAVKAAERLRQDGYEFELNMIGTGVMEEELRSMIADRQLEDVVHLLGSMPPENVRTHMETASIFLFTSDRQEGWGAVLNESMNSGCAVVACSAIGSVPFLLKDGENGSTYPEGDFEAFYAGVKKLLDDGNLRERYGRAAYRTITETWCAEVAAERLITLAECLKNGKDTPFADGPCSRAEILREER